MDAGSGQSSSAAPAKPIALMRVAGFEPFVAFLRRERAPVELLPARGNLPAAVLERPEHLMTVTQAVRFMEDAASVLGLDNLGARARRATPATSLGTFGSLIGRASTAPAVPAEFKLIVYLACFVVWPQLDAGDTAGRAPRAATVERSA